MKPSDPSNPAVEATTDAVFQEGSPIPAIPAPDPAAGATSRPNSPPASTSEVEEFAQVDPTILLVPPPIPEGQPPAPAGGAAPLGDYVRELGEEFQKQQDEGKL
jgi:hypothetical protein